MTRIKICGVNNFEIAELCAVMGVNFIGLDFTPGRWRVNPELARSITGYISANSLRPVVVGIFANMPNYEVNLIAEYCDLDWIQLSGNESLKYAKELRRPVVRVKRISPDFKPEDVQQLVNDNFSTRAVCLFEGTGGENSMAGGAFDWSVLAGLPPFIPVFVGGGLAADNVGSLIEKYRPWGVNVNAGVERRGRKSQSKIKAFINAVRDADSKID